MVPCIQWAYMNTSTNYIFVVDFESFASNFWMWANRGNENLMK
jgi:hypothetical protein